MESFIITKILKGFVFFKKHILASSTSFNFFKKKQYQEVKPTNFFVLAGSRVEVNDS